MRNYRKSRYLVTRLDPCKTVIAEMPRADPDASGKRRRAAKRIFNGLIHEHAAFRPPQEPKPTPIPSTGRHPATPMSSISSRRVAAQRSLVSLHRFMAAASPRRVSQVAPFGS